MNRLDLFSFKEGMDKVANTFGAKHYSEDRRELIYNYVQMLPKDEFLGIVERMLAELKVTSPPLPKDFEDAARIVRNRIYDEQKQGAVQRRSESGRPDCMDCAGMGLVEAHEKEAKFCIHFKCHCEKGNQHPTYNLPRWGRDYFGKYVMLQMWPDRIKYWQPGKDKDVWDLVQEYGARVKISEEYWQYHGF